MNIIPGFIPDMLLFLAGDHSGQNCQLDANIQRLGLAVGGRLATETLRAIIKY